MELCEVCHVNTATIHLTQIEQGESVTRHLCEECAGEEGIPLINETGLSLDNDSEDEEEKLQCERCGTTEDELIEKGILGCIHCYEAFHSVLAERSDYRQVYRRYDGKKYRQSGSRAFRTELDTLRRELATAIKEERFEVATVLRDRIRDLENNEENLQWS